MTVQAIEATHLDVAGVPTALIDIAPSDPGIAHPPVLLLHGSGPGVTAQMREVIGLFAHDRDLITDELRGPALPQLRPAACRNARAMTPYPAVLACWFGPRGGAAHSHVHRHRRATLRGTLPSPGDVA
jgi:hypothetical protein